MEYLIPVPKFRSGFTTSVDLHAENLTQAALTDSSLGVHKVTSRTAHPLVPPPQPVHDDPSDLSPPRLAWEATYPKGSINPSAQIPGGFGYYISGPSYFKHDLSRTKETVLSYRMMLQEGWQWAKGGKLPGVCTIGFEF
jgi:hypothetical protein